MIDAIVVGAGLAGAIMAEQLASKYSNNVLVVERRLNVGGHCYDKVSKSGIRLHMYGPHLFHTDSLKVWNYLSRFTDWSGSLASTNINNYNYGYFIQNTMESALNRFTEFQGISASILQPLTSF